MRFFPWGRDTAAIQLGDDALVGRAPRVGYGTLAAMPGDADGGGVELSTFASVADAQVRWTCADAAAWRVRGIEQRARAVPGEGVV